jgi:hypothetical protein
MSFLEIFLAGLNDFVHLNVFGHVLFIVALCGVFTLRSWQKVTGYVIVFVLSYLSTFFISWAGIFDIPHTLIKILLPCTVIVTAFVNFFVKKKSFTNRYPSQNYRYYFAIPSGLIHGFAFSDGKTGIELTNALVYNAGLIACIILIMFVLLMIARFLTYTFRVNLREWNLIISGACAGIAAFKIYLGI